MAFLQKLEKGFIKVVEILCTVSMAAMVLLVGAQVVLRFIVHNALDMSWSEELVRFMLCYTVFFGTVLVYEKHDHVWVANLVDAVPNAARKLMLTASYIIQAAFCVCVFIGTTKYMPIAATQYSNVLHIPLNYLYSVIPVTIAFTLIFCIRDLVLMLIGKGDLKNG